MISPIVTEVRSRKLSHRSGPSHEAFLSDSEIIGRRSRRPMEVGHQSLVGARLMVIEGGLSGEGAYNHETRNDHMARSAGGLGLTGAMA